MENEDLILDMSKEIIKYSPSDYPLLATLKELQCVKECCQTKFRWFQITGKNCTQIDNCLQIFRTNFSNINDKKAKAIEHAKSIEEVLWNGEKETCETCGKLKMSNKVNIDMPGVRKTGGVIQFLKDNKRTLKLKKDFSEKDFNDFLFEGFRYGSNTKALFADDKSFDCLCKMFKGKFADKTVAPFNKDAKVLITDFGEVHIIKNPIFKSRMLCLLDIPLIQYRYLVGRDTKLNILKEKKYNHYYITECGLQIGNPDNHLLASIN